ncbi:hypothetical protein MMC07_003929 [Pseudocyphellaria aurata]|nr:hypothetical protein [Pseudocyphellaria aurata]
MGAKKRTRQTDDSSVIPPAKSRGSVVKSSSTSKSICKTRSKAASPSGSCRSPKAPSETPPLIASPSADARDKTLERKNDDTAPIYVYKVMQHLDIMGDKEFKDEEKITVLGTFDDVMKANDAAFRQYEALAAFADSISTIASKPDGMVWLKISQRKLGYRNEVKFEVVREVQEIVSLLEDAKDDVSNSKTDDKSVCAYKVVQHLDIEGDEEFEDVQRFRVLGTFENIEKANDAAFRQQRVLGVFADSISSGSTKREDDLLSLTILQQKGGSRKEAKIEVKSADAEDESETYDKPVYNYQVVQHLDIVGDKEFEDLEKVKVLGTFDDMKNANLAAFKHYEVLVAFADSKSARISTSRNGRLSLTMIQKKRGSRKEVNIKVEREVRKSSAPREVFVVLCEDRVNVLEPGVTGDLAKRSILGIYQDLESAVERLQKEPSDLYEAWKRDLEEPDNISDSDFFDREDSMVDGRTVIKIFNAAANLVVKLSISVEHLL